MFGTVKKNLNRLINRLAWRFNRFNRLNHAVNLAVNRLNHAANLAVKIGQSKWFNQLNHGKLGRDIYQVDKNQVLCDQ